MADENTYRNPVDGKNYVAKDGWETYEPQGETNAESSSERIKTAELRLLTTQDQIAERTSVESLATFAKMIEKSAQEAFDTASEKSTVLVQFSCTPGKHDVKLAHQGDVAQELLQNYYDRLQQLEVLPVSAGEVSFQLTIQIAPIGR